MEAIVNTVRGLWQAQDRETISQKSLLGRSPAGSFHAWIIIAKCIHVCAKVKFSQAF